LIVIVIYNITDKCGGDTLNRTENNLLGRINCVLTRKYVEGLKIMIKTQYNVGIWIWGIIYSKSPTGLVIVGGSQSSREKGDRTNCQTPPSKANIYYKLTRDKPCFEESLVQNNIQINNVQRDRQHACQTFHLHLSQINLNQTLIRGCDYL
jgi:hypothetical protein